MYQEKKKEEEKYSEVQHLSSMCKLLGFFPVPQNKKKALHFSACLHKIEFTLLKQRL
jgi:hypothetical protein